MQPRFIVEHDRNSPGLELLSPDRRADPRFLTVYRLVKVAHDGDEGLGRCRNISDSGAKVELHMGLQLNERVSIAFSSADVVTGKVVWANGNIYGIAFDEPVDCMAMLGNLAPRRCTTPPRSPRLDTRLPATIAYSGGSCQSVVSDISVRGMKVASAGAFEPGLRVRVILDGGRESEGVVRWSHDSIAGIMLLEPFAVEELGSVRRLSGTDGN